MSNSTALNLEAICAAIDQHNSSCDYPAVEVRLCFYEHERLGWDEVKGIPIKVDETLQSGRFRVVCSKELDSPPAQALVLELIA